MWKIGVGKMFQKGDMGLIKDQQEGWRYKYEDLREGKEGNDSGVGKGD